MPLKTASALRSLALARSRSLSRRLSLALSLSLSLALGVGEARAQRAAQQANINDPQVQAALRALEQEPTIQEVQQAALRFYHVESETVESLRSRAALKSLAPDINASYRAGNNGVFINQFDYLNGDQTQNYQVGRDFSRGDVYEWQVSGSWSLSRLVFNPEVLDVASMAAIQEGVLKEITRLYYTRRRLQVDLIFSNPQDPATRMSKQLRIDQITATIDALTNNLLSKHAENVKGFSQEGRSW